MTDTAAWDRLTAGVRDILPAWAKYQGFGTWALGGYAYAIAMVAIAGIVYTRGYTTATIVAVLLGLFALSTGRYYHTAAKLRLTCNHCGTRARGKNICPDCGELTFKGGENA